MIEYVNVTKQFGPLTVLDGINLTIKDGEITYVIGSSGTGKSVLVKHAVGLLRPDAGRILIDNIDTTNFNEQQWNQIRMRYALVFQHPTLFDSKIGRAHV